MTRYFILFAALFIFAPQAHAETVYAISKVNLRAGPDGGYPVVDILKRNEQVDLIGCIQGYQWCEVETKSGEHGWVYAHYLSTSYSDNRVTIVQTNGNGIRIVTYYPNFYWNNYYRNKYFYPERYRWIPRDSHDGYNHHHNHNDDDDDHHGHHDDDDDRPPVIPKPEPAPLKYKPAPTPSRHKYNPLCPMGETNC